MIVVKTCFSALIFQLAAFSIISFLLVAAVKPWFLTLEFYIFPGFIYTFIKSQLHFHKNWFYGSSDLHFF